MTVLTPIYVWRSPSGYGLRERLVMVSDADADDTVTISELDDVTDTVAISLLDGAAVTCSESGNEVTVDPSGSLSNSDVLILVSGN